jgi:hypothetical protein
VSERVLERVLDVGEQPRLVQELRGLQLAERLRQRVLRHLRDGGEEGHRHVLADHGSGLEQALQLRAQPIDARRQDGLDRRRHLDRRRRASEAVRARLPGEGAHLDEG